MRIAIVILAASFLAVTSAAAKSAKSFAPGHHAKGIHEASFNAPGHEKKNGCAGSSKALNELELTI
jgi:Spy/CpxP family protein refolding chaperone